MDRIALLNSAALITAAFAANVNCRADDLPRVLETTFGCLEKLAKNKELAIAPEEVQQPEAAVSVRKSLANPDFIISMIDGKPYKTLRRHLTTHNYTPESYRAAFDLKPDYPMVAVNYSENRRRLAKQIGLGTKANRGA